MQTSLRGSLASISLSLLLFNQTASALPLLSENAAKRVSEILTLYPDSQDPNKFYYFPNSSRLAQDQNGRPLFSLAYYGLDNEDKTDGGGLLNAVFRLDMNQPMRKAVREFLDQNPHAGLAVLPVKASTVASGQLNMYTSLHLPEHGGRAEDEMGMSIELTEIGAMIFRAKAKSGTGPQLNYCYKVEGLGPNMDAHIVMEWKQLYEYFRASSSAGALWWRTTITREVEKLYNTQHIFVTINGGDAQKQDYIFKLVDQMIAKLFEPKLNYNRSATQVLFESTPLQFNLNSVTKEELHRFEGRVVMRDLVEREYCVDLTVKDVEPYYNELVIRAD